MEPSISSNGIARISGDACDYVIATKTRFAPEQNTKSWGEREKEQTSLQILAPFIRSSVATFATNFVITRV